MTIRKLILALRGFDDINSSKDKRVFWNSFINLQKNLPTNVQIKFILQYYEGQESKLFSFLFEPFLEFNFNSDNLSFDFKKNKKHVFFKRNINNQISHSLKESYCISSISSYLANKKYEYKLDQLILLNYKLLKLNESKSLFIYDNLLPSNKIYLRYSGYIDQGYPSNLIVIPSNFLEIFSKFHNFFLNSISNENNFLKKYNIFRSSLSYRRKAFKEFLFLFKTYFKNLVIDFLHLLENNILKLFDIRILRFIIKKVKVFVDIPYLTRENSFVKDSINENIFYLKRISPLKPILKHFIYENYLRTETRFISDDDFENYKDSYIIGKKNFILVLKDDFSLNEKTIKSQLYDLKFKPKLTLLVKKNKIIVYNYFQKPNRFLKEMFFKYKKDEFQNILYVLFKIKINKQYNYNPPILILDSLSSYKTCTDLGYFNALLQFFIWEDINYVSFENINCKKKYSAFPDLYFYRRKNKFNLEKCIINLKLLKELKYANSLKLKSENYNSILILDNQKKLFL